MTIWKLFLFLTFLTIFPSTVYTFPSDISSPLRPLHPIGFNWIVSVSDRCQGFFISSNVIITAAHCVQDEDVKFLKLYSREGKAVFEFHEEESFTVIVHPDFDNNRKQNDIAIIKLQFPFSEHILTSNGHYPNPNPNLAFLNEPNQLDSVSLQILDGKYCKRKYTNPFNPITQICGIEEKGSMTKIMHGHSGSPLLHDGVIVGMMSYGPKSASFGQRTPLVLTNISSYQDWILKQQESSPASNPDETLTIPPLIFYSTSVFLIVIFLALVLPYFFKYRTISHDFRV